MKATKCNLPEGSLICDMTICGWINSPRYLEEQCYLNGQGCKSSLKKEIYNHTKSKTSELVFNTPDFVVFKPCNVACDISSSKILSVLQIPHKFQSLAEGCGVRALL